ncbi:MAG: zinc-dependent metalloprotease, partial [Bacteroidia bacterium]|nr:zinc-dependent metalloprotease [Bacteroidia bacterium]
SNGCGEAWAVSVSVYADAFCVTDRGCAVGNLTFPHEFGHLYGCRHDPYVDNSTTPYAYAHGKVVYNSYRTVMAYVDDCDANGATCPRVAYFSNPAITYLGTSTGTTNLRDNESGHEASRVAISGLETSLTNKTFPSWTHDDGEYGDVLGITSVSNTTTYVMNSGSEVVWRAGTYHVMQPGFWAKAGSKFLTMFDDCTPLTIAEPSNEKATDRTSTNGFVKVQPNPFQDQFNAVVEMAESGFLKLELLDGTGKLIQLVSEQRSASEGPHSFTIDMSDKAEGIYFLLVRRGEEVKTMKLIKVE